jgi:hypothetical protein
MYIYEDEPQWMSYTTCGDAGKRTVTFDWRVGRYQSSETYRFSATFYEDKPGRIVMRYFDMSDKGSSATVGIEGKRNGKSKSFIRKEWSCVTNCNSAAWSTYSQKQPKISTGLAIVWDPVALSWSKTA